MASPVAGARIHWIDFAKAAAVILVVVYHVGSSMDVLFPSPTDPGSAFWTRVNLLALPLRMPLFFLVAGLLAKSAMSRPWNAVARPRVLVLLWPYLLWTIAFAVVGGFAYRPDAPIRYGVDRLLGLPFARSGYWFLLVLALFFVVAKLLQRWSTVVLIAALILAVASPWLESHVFNDMNWLTAYGTIRVARYAFWYLLGCYAAGHVLRAANANPVRLAAGGGVVFISLTWLAYRMDSVAELMFVVSAAGVVAMVGASVWAVRFGAVRSASAYLARRSLPIYLIHPMLIVAVVVVARQFGWLSGPNNLLATLLVPLIASLSILAAVTLFDSISKSRMTWIFTPPTSRDRADHR